MGIFSNLFGGGKKRILVVDDEEANRELVKDVLSADGYSVYTAEDGVRGLEEYRKRSYDLVILDANMPKMDGFELLRMIRRTPAGRKQGVIMLSGEGMLDPITDAFAQGIIAWIPKPFAVPDLLVKVSDYFAKKG